MSTRAWGESNDDYSLVHIGAYRIDESEIEVNVMLYSISFTIVLVVG